MQEVTKDMELKPPRHYFPPKDSLAQSFRHVSIAIAVKTEIYVFVHRKSFLPQTPLPKRSDGGTDFACENTTRNI